MIIRMLLFFVLFHILSFSEVVEGIHRQRTDVGLWADGSIVNLHHVGQNGLGPLVEASERSHTSILHRQFGTRQSHPDYPINRPVFDTDRKAYWKGRAENVNKK